MAEKKRLEELYARSKPALAHGPLVALVRENSPNLTRELAEQAGFGQRQVRAARWLAILRRDHGDEVFEAYVQLMEHARRAQPLETTPAQEKGTMENERKERVLKALEKVKSPKEKLELLFDQGLKEEALSCIEELIETHSPCFYWSDDGGWIKTAKLPEAKGYPLASTFKELKNTYVVFFEKDKISSFHNSIGELQLPLNNLAAFVEWDETELRKFVSKILEKQITYPPGDGFFWATIAGDKMCELLIPEGHELHQPVLRWCLQCRCMDLRITEISQIAPSWRRDLCDIRISDERRKLDPLVDYMHELGMSEGEICQFMLDWLRNHAESGSWNELCLVAVSHAKCFKYGDPERELILHEGYLEPFWKKALEYSVGWRWRNFDQLHEVGMWDRHDVDFFRPFLVRELSLGRASWVFQFFLHFGERAGLYNKTWGEREKSSAKEAMKSLAAKAYQLAVDEGRYGIAAALSQQFDVLDHEKLSLKADDSVREEFVKMLGKEEGPEDMRLTLREGLLLTKRDGNLLSDEEYLDEGFPEPPDDKKRQAHFSMIELGEKRLENLGRFRAEAEKKLEEILELAVTLKQPIALNCTEVMFEKPD